MDSREREIVDILVETDGFPALKFYTLDLMISGLPLDASASAKLSGVLSSKQDLLDAACISGLPFEVAISSKMCDDLAPGQDFLDAVHTVWTHIASGEISSDEDFNSRYAAFFEFIQAEYKFAKGDVSHMV